MERIIFSLFWLGVALFGAFLSYTSTGMDEFQLMLSLLAIVIIFTIIMVSIDFVTGLLFFGMTFIGVIPLYLIVLFTIGYLFCIVIHYNYLKDQEEFWDNIGGYH